MPSQQERLPCALSVSGLDPGGGAGIAADLRAFRAAGVFGCAAITLTTVQSTNGLLSATPLPSKEVVAMAREVLRAQDVRAIKVGALGSAANVKAVAELVRKHAALPLVVDPVMGASRGRARLAAEAAVTALRKELLPRATLITPNVPEAEALTGLRIASLSDAKKAARALCDLGARAAMVKGGHLAGAQSTDVVAFEDGTELALSSVRLPIRTRIHGGGCTLASLIAGRLAHGDELRDALKWSKRALDRALPHLRNVGGELRVIVFD
ncbi:MAG: bifunctional hydroxymethylpyrimidine kinase/phosphomethylpyrimidine kinase [Polyangiaceae bacterium]